MSGKSKPSRWEWDFSKADKSGVPDTQLVACCYWEYACESDFIRRVVQRLKDVNQRKITRPLVTTGKPWVQTHCLRLLKEAGATVELPALRRGAQSDYSRYYKEMLEAQAAQPESVADAADLYRLYSIGVSVVNLFTRLPFPKPWQSLTLAQRSVGEDFVPKNPTPAQIPPFRTSNDYLVASELYSQARRIRDKEDAVRKRLAEIDGGVANLEEAAKLRNTLCEQAKHPTPVASRGIGGVDFFIAQINWHDFDDKEIVKCFERWVKDKGNRPIPVTQQPKGVRGLRGGPGRDAYEWRASLERLGLLRLRRRYTFTEAKPFLAKLPETTKTTTASECNRDAKKTVDDFHTFFPSLDSAELSLSMK